MDAPLGAACGLWQHLFLGNLQERFLKTFLDAGTRLCFLPAEIGGAVVRNSQFITMCHYRKFVMNELTPFKNISMAMRDKISPINLSIARIPRQPKIFFRKEEAIRIKREANQAIRIAPTMIHL